jgi:mRNA interferase MazF
MKYKKYDVVLVDFGTNTVGSEQGGVRCAVIIQNDIGNKHSSTTIVMPFTTKLKNANQPTHALFKVRDENGLKYDSMLLGECMRQVSEDRIIRTLGQITTTEERNAVKQVYLANWEV